MNRTVMLRYSKDGGNNWSPYREASLGAKGQFLHPVEFRRFGRAAEEWIFEIAVSSPIQRDLIDASWLPQQTE